MLTYLPRKVVAEVSKDKEPIGRECAEFVCGVRVRSSIGSKIN